MSFAVFGAEFIHRAGRPGSRGTVRFGAAGLQRYRLSCVARFRHAGAPEAAA